MTACGDRHTILERGRQVVVACSIDRGHAGDHQAYHRDQLH